MGNPRPVTWLCALPVLALICGCRKPEAFDAAGNRVASGAASQGAGRQVRQEGQLRQDQEAGLQPAFGTDGANRFRLPLWFGEVPDRAGVFLVLERGEGEEDAHIWVLEPKGKSYARRIFYSVPVQTSGNSSAERALLGLAFQPGYARNGRYFLNYIPKRKPGQVRDSTCIEERRADASLTRDAGTPGKRILAFAQPYANHNGGSLAFGPRDGFLYIGIGDGGSGGDPKGNGQELGTLLGKMLRLDVDHADAGLAYAIPADNPFRDRHDALPEIWAYGLRNPWKWSFDSLTGDLWAGDVGQNRREEVDRIGKGSNLGWNRMEGADCFQPSRGCESPGLVLPEADLDREAAQSITGGYVYRGDPKSPFYGAYVFGDYITANLWALFPARPAGDRLMKLGRVPDQPSSFGVDGQGNIYVVGYVNGTIYRLGFPASPGI